MWVRGGEWSVWVRGGEWSAVSVCVREGEWFVWVKEGVWSVCVRKEWSAVGEGGCVVCVGEGRWVNLCG